MELVGVSALSKMHQRRCLRAIAASRYSVAAENPSWETLSPTLRKEAEKISLERNAYNYFKNPAILLVLHSHG